MEEQKDNEELISKVYNYAANLMEKEGKGAWETKEKLIEHGVDAESAQIIVDNIEQKIEEARYKKAKNDMLYGGLWCIGGIIVTIVTYSAASGGGSYMVAWGAIIFGAIQFIKGASNAS